MKKKNIAILLLLPYVVALLGVITVNITFKAFENDITYIEWEYADIEAFQLKNTRYPLKAVGVTATNLPLAEGNNLVWSVQNTDGAKDPHAVIEESDGAFYLVPKSEGEMTLTCSNAKGNITRRTTIIIYLNSVIFVRSKIQSSQNNIDNTVYYGQYDLNNGKKQQAVIEMEFVCLPQNLESSMTIASQSDNLQIDTKGGKVKIIGAGQAGFTLTAGKEEDGTRTSYKHSFEVVKDGVNVYTYDDLMACTNRSKNGEIVVLRKSFESIQNAFTIANGNVVERDGKPLLRANNVENFGTYDKSLGRCAFDGDVYRFATTSNRSYIDQWNAFAKENNNNYRGITDIINVGLHVQKDFYGNGYTINLHNLTFPYDIQEFNQDGNLVSIPTLTKDNLFRGPLPFYTLGDPNGMPLITPYGQDNIGMYVHGDNIRVNDVNLKNCDIGDSFTNLEYVGTVVEIYGDNITLQNSVFQNGKHVVRAFSSENAVIDNCLLQNALNFLLITGSNEYIPVKGDKEFTLKDAEGNAVKTTLNEFLAENGAGNDLLNTYLADYYDISTMKDSLNVLQAALGDEIAFLEYRGSMEVKDTLFYRSGIASICMESSFNGPFLYTTAPSLISELFSIFTENSRPLVPLTPTNVSGVSYPVSLNISGSTKFYDYKTAEDMDFTGLINENISTIASDILTQLGKDKEVNVTIDDIFPLKGMLYSDAQKAGSIYNKDGKAYLNVAVAFYGGGLNLSRVTFDGLDEALSKELNPVMPVEWVDSYLAQQFSLSGSPTEMLQNLSGIQTLMQKTVTVVTGTDPFKFICSKGNGYLYGETPRVEELRANNLK